MPALKIAEEVRDALAARRPVVALETTIVTHGMPYPENVATARSLEAEIRAGGAVPATIAVMSAGPSAWASRMANWSPWLRRRAC